MLPKENRLRQKRDFKRLYNRGKSQANNFFVIYWRKNGQKDSRIGFSISKKLGKAVQRNLLKRRCKMAARTLLDEFLPGYDYVFIVRANAAGAEYAQIAKQMAKAINFSKK